jgi:hypothetical protein
MTKLPEGVLVGRTSWEGWQGRLSGSNKLGRVASGKLDASNH